MTSSLLPAPLPDPNAVFALADVHVLSVRPIILKQHNDFILRLVKLGGAQWRSSGFLLLSSAAGIYTDMLWAIWKYTFSHARWRKNFKTYNNACVSSLRHHRLCALTVWRRAIYGIRRWFTSCAQFVVEYLYVRPFKWRRALKKLYNVMLELSYRLPLFQIKMK